MKIEQQTKNNFLPAASSNRDRIRLIWHRRDLRLHDNELYHYDDQHQQQQQQQQQQQHHDDHDDTGEDLKRCLDASPKIISSSSSISSSSISGTSISLFIFDPHYFNPQPSCTEHSHIYRGKQKENNNSTTHTRKRTDTDTDTDTTNTSASTSNSPGNILMSL